MKELCIAVELADRCFTPKRAGRWTAASFLLIGILLTSCADQPPGEAALTPTELQRFNLDAKTRAYLDGAQAALANGSVSQALVMADSAVERAPGLSDAYFIRARVLETLRQFGEAESAYQKVLQLDPGYRIAVYNLGNIAFQQDRFKDALAHYFDALDISDLQGAGPQDFPDDLDHESQTAALVQIGRTCAKLGSFDEALHAYDLALAIDSTHAAAYSDQSVLYKEAGDLETAIALARKAAELDPTNVDFLYHLGGLLVQQGAYEEAMGILSDVIEKRPWQQGAHFNLGQALVRLGRVDEGNRILEKADEVQQLQSRIDQLNANLNKQPDSPGNWLELGKAYTDAGRYEEAVEVYNYLLQFLPDRADAWYGLGVALHGRSDDRNARYALRSALEHDPNLLEASQLLEQITP